MRSRVANAITRTRPTELSFFGLGAASALAVVLLLAASRAEAHYDPNGETKLWTYNSSSCATRVDPVSVVFYQNATDAKMHEHAHHHGGWGEHTGTGQYFYDHGCGFMDGQHASVTFGLHRFHMRQWWNSDPGNLEIYTLTSPHKEKVTIPCGHVVYDNVQSPPGGFVQGKWDIGYNWHNWNNGGGSHYFLGTWWYGGTDLMTQCNGEKAGNDGGIDYVQVQ